MGGARGYVSFFFFLYFLLTKFDCPSRATVVYWFTVFLEEGRVSVRVLSVSFPVHYILLTSFSFLLLLWRTSRGFLFLSLTEGLPTKGWGCAWPACQKDQEWRRSISQTLSVDGRTASHSKHDIATPCNIFCKRDTPGDARALTALASLRHTTPRLVISPYDLLNRHDSPESA